MPLPLNPLHALHEQAEATFLPYGSDLQIVESYGEVEAEYAALRKAAALMDAPHRSVIILTGKDRLAFLHNKLTNDTNRLTPGQGCYSYLLNLKGRIVMDLNILHAEEATLVELDRRLAVDFLRTMEKYIFNEDVRILDGSEQLGRLTVLGPKAHLLLKKVMEGGAGGGGSGETGVDALTESFRHAKRTIGKATVTVFRNDLAGEPQFELIVPRDQLVALWQILHEAGHDSGGGDEHDPAALTLRAIGWAAFNTARIEAGTPLFGIDISDHYLPMETAHWYLRAVSVTKGCYLGQEIVARMHAHNTVARLLVGLRAAGSGRVPTPGSTAIENLPIAGTHVFERVGEAGAAGGGAAASQEVGIVTSSCMSPMLGYVPIALGFVKKAYAAPGVKTLELLAPASRLKADILPLPFWQKSTAAPSAPP